MKTLKLTFLFSLLSLFAVPTMAYMGHHGDRSQLIGVVALPVHSGANAVSYHHRATHNSSWRPRYIHTKTHTITKCNNVTGHCQVTKKFLTIHRAHRTGMLD